MDTIRLKVAAKSDPKSVAGAIVNYTREKKNIEIVVMGANAVNQCIKAIAIANEYAAPDGLEILCKPGFTHLELDGEKKSAMVLKIIAKVKE